MGKALIFDGNSILNRAFYGVRPLTAPDGLPTNALFGFVGMINKAFSQIGGSADYAAIAFDLKEKTFRHKECDFYKATRKPMPEELALQLPFAKELAAALGLKVITLAGYEADDILGTLSARFTEMGDETFIVTGDRDSFQLVNDKVTVLLSSNDDTKVTTPKEIMEKYGVEPRKLIDIKAIMGDSSDNIPGVPGIGEKGAIKLMAQYGDLDSIYAHAEEIGGAVGNKLREGKESAYISRFLAEIKLDVPIGDVSEYAYNGSNIPALRELYIRFGFKQFLDKLDSAAPCAAECEEYLPLTEMGDISGETLYINLNDNEIYIFAKGKCFKGDAAEGVRLAAECERAVCWSAKELLHFAKLQNASFKELEDISLMAYVCSPADNGVSFGRVALDNLGVNTSEVLVSLLPEMHAKLSEKLTPALKRLYKEVELPLAELLCRMEMGGFPVDKQALTSFSEVLSKAIAEEEQAIYALAGEEFNINSPKQLGNILFEKLMLPHYRKTKSGYSTDRDTLEKLEPYHPIIGLILEYREDAKLKNTYCDGLSKQITRQGRIHTTFKQTQTLTGRLSSAEPNLQNIPVRTERGREFRKFFVAEDGHILIDADYSQIELRVLAHVSGDENLINAFKAGEDIHTVTASQVFGVPAEQVSGEMRKRAKAVNFGIIYGIGDYSLSQDLKIPRRTAAEYIENYLAKYPGVRDYLQHSKDFARENGYAESIFGRRRYIPELSASNKITQAFGERVAMNMPIQGAAADLIKMAMIRADRMLNEAGLEAKLILQIHDELIIDCPVEEADRAEAILRDAMQGAAELLVPLAVDIGRGKSWYDAKN